MLRTRSLLFIFAAALLFSAGTFSQTIRGKVRTQKFTSLYTDLDRQCKNALSKKEQKESEARGQDPVYRCRGYGGYHIIMGYTGIGSTQIHIAPDHCKVCENKDIILLIPHEQNTGATATAKRVEWRLADGKPFAVIARFSKYDPPDDLEGSPFQDKYKAGELLLVRGLKGFDRINFDVEAKSSGANESAREIADKAFLDLRMFR